MIRRRPDLTVVAVQARQRELILWHEVTCRRSQQRLYMLMLADLHGNEESLREGRFEHFTAEPQEHGYTLPLSVVSLPSERWFTERLEWIAEMAQGPWSFAVEARHVHDIEFRFTFTHVTTAVAFALVWADA